MADEKNTEGWTRTVIDIDNPKTKEELERYSVNIREVLDKVLKDNDHLARAYKKRYQQARFCAFLGAIYTDKSVYDEDEKKNKLKKLKAYYNREYKQTKSRNTGKVTYAYISPTTAEFYCDLLDKINAQIELDYPGINLPKEEIHQPFSRDKIDELRGNGGKTPSTPDKDDPKGGGEENKTKQIYYVIDLSKLSFLTPEQLHTYGINVLKNTTNLTKETKDKLVDLIQRLEYAYSHARNTNDSLQMDELIGNTLDLFQYKSGKRLSVDTQKLYVTFVDNLEKEIAKHHSEQIPKVKINLLYTISQDGPTPPVPPTPTEELHSFYTSDEWKQLLDGSKIGDQMPIFLQMTGDTLHMQEGLEISALREVLGDDFPSADFEKLNTANEKEEKIQELKSNLTPVQLARFNVKLVEDAQKLAEVLPPHQLVVMCKEIDTQIQNKKGNKDELEQLAKQKETFVKAMLQKTSDYVEGNTIVDEKNVADVYDGAMEMFDYLDKQTDVQDRPVAKIKELTSEARAKIKPKIDEYDKINFLIGIKEEDAEKIEQSFDKVWNEIKDLDFENEEIAEKYGVPLDKLRSIEFEGSDSEKAEKRKTFIDTIKVTVARKVALATLGKNDEEYAQILKEQVEGVTTSYVDTLKTTTALSKLSENVTQEQRDNEIASALQSNPYLVSDGGIATFEAAMVNDHISFLNRLASTDKLKDRAAKVLNKMYGPITNIDKTCISRFGTAYKVPRDFIRMTFKNMGSQATNVALRIGCNLVCNDPLIGSKVYAGIYAVQAVNRLLQARKYEKQLAEDRGEKFNKGRFWLSKTPEILMSAAGTAAAFFAGPLAARGLQSVVRYGMLATGWTISFVKGTIASRKQGDGWFKSIGKAASNASLSTASAVATGVLFAGGINMFSNMTSDFFGEKISHTPNASEYDANDSSFTKDVIPVDELNQDGTDLRELSDEQLAEKGMIREPAQAGEEGAYIVQEGTEPYTTHDYSDNELAKAAERNADPRFSEFLNNQQGGYHVAPDLQDSTNPDIVSSTATGNLGNAIEELARQHTEFQTSNEDGTTQTNTQMLMYKLTQMAYLVPNTEAPMDNGSTAGEYFSYTDEHGNTINYMELLREGVQNGKFSNPDAALEILTKVELHVGGQIDDNVNDLGKIEGFGNQIENGRPVNSYQENNHGFTVNNHPGSSDVYEKISQIEQHNYIPTIPLFDRIWAGVKEVPGKLREIMGANARRKDGADKVHLQLNSATPNQR